MISARETGEAPAVGWALRRAALGTVMIAVQEHLEGCLLPVRAQPGARQTGIVGEHGGALKVAVSAPPEQGKANQAIAEVLREAFGLKRSQVELVSGETHREKRFLLRGVTKREVEQRLGELLG